MEELMRKSIYGVERRDRLSILSTAFLLSAIFCFSLSSSAAETPKRIVSLAPNMTELLYALGLEDRIVGVTSFCDYPAAAKKKPKIGGMSNPSLEAVIALKPDMVVMTVDGNPKEFEERLRSMKIKTYVFRYTRLREFPRGVRDMGAALGAVAKADALAGEIEKKLADLGEKRPSFRKDILFVVWPEPLIVAGPGSIADDALGLLGQKNIAGAAKSSYPKYSIEEIIRSAPDIIFIGKGEGMDKVSEGFLKHLRSVPAVKNRKAFYVSDHLYRLTPRTVSGVEELAGYLER